MRKLDSTQKLTLLGATAFTLVLLGYIGKGYSIQFHQANPEMWMYAAMQALGTTSLFCLSTYLLLIIVDLFRAKRRITGWLICAALSWTSVFQAC